MMYRNRMKVIMCLLCIWVTNLNLFAQKKVLPNVAYQDGKVRITIITEGVARLEYVPDGKFVDNNSFIAVNRNYPKVDYKLKNSGKMIEICTSKMILKYKKNTGKFTADNLSITSVKGKGFVPFAWKPGLTDYGNLKGTYRTLDSYKGNLHLGDNKPMPIEDGLLSTSGWKLIDDSKSYLFDHSDWPWVMERPEKGQTQDWYFMAYGHNYKSALKDFTLFSGKVPLPPRYAFGYWWSRYWSYSDDEIRSLVNNFHAYDIPLDVLVVDMDWHYTEPGKGGWTGYTWNRRLFPDPDGFLKYIKNNNLKITLNLHPADGVASYETHFPEMAQWMGVDTTKTKVIPWEASNKKFMEGWFNTQLRPLEKAGVDFWWLDWQQWPNDKKFTDLSNTWWLNYTLFTDMQRNRDTRPMLYHRWGGLGNHRYQIGFSGDSFISWESLDYQPYYNMTASNVLYGYWSHDIGGHMGVDNINPELYIRWFQFGALSPILRTHSTKNAGLNKEPWAFAQQYIDIIRNTVQKRYEMVPYIYAMARKDYNDAISLCRPMYYDYPENKEAYTNRNEYMFGDNVLVYPITSPMKNGKSTLNVWLPAGNDWYEWHTGTLLKGGQTIERTFRLDEYPIYVKAGSVLPFYNKEVKNLKSNDETIEVTVFPGMNGSFNMYEDNGNDKNYATQYTITKLTSEKVGNTLTVNIGERKGLYPDMPSNRNFKVKVLASAVPEKVTVDGMEIKPVYDGNELTLSIDIPQKDCSIAKVIKVTYPSGASDVTDGLLGQMRHVRNAVLNLKRQDAGVVLNEGIGSMESTGIAISYYPNEFEKRIETFRKNFANMRELLKEQKTDEQRTEDFLNIAK
ncbi:alpha-xylosidase [Prevotella herbatica]|uniref:Alpha-xylosidase n=2 Tax=Prevotella herbatica TaxID=2801997 RepID=A0ABN6EHI8_9BACT|nr:alpha-xylosidase [Prevotella herbatica]